MEVKNMEEKDNFLKSLQVSSESMEKSQQKNVSKTEIEKQTEFLHDTMFSLMDSYLDKNSQDAREYLCYLTAAIYITYREKYEDLVTRIPFRTKGDLSYMRNMQKETINNIQTLTPPKKTKHIDLKYLRKKFDTFPILKDIQGMTVVLDSFRKDITLPRNNSMFKSPLIHELIQKKIVYTNRIRDIEPQVSDFISEKKYLLIKEELLKAIIDMDYPEFTEETFPSYAEELQSTQTRLKNGEALRNFSTSITNIQKLELENLLGDLEYRLDDRLQYEILRETLPDILKSPLIKDVLNVTFKFSKDCKKPNGFAAQYFVLHTPFGDMELQAQSKQRFYEAKRGSAFHSGMPGKSVNIKDFFEYVNPENETMPLSEFLEELDIPDSILDEEKHPELSSIYKEKLSHIRIKDKIKVLPSLPIHWIMEMDLASNDDEGIKAKKKIEDKISALIESGELQPVAIDADDYLYSSAISYSACLNTCSSGHGFSANAAIHHQDIDDEFTEVLRKRDAVTCLGSLLLERLRTILRTTKKDDYYNVRKNDSIANLPKLITKNEIKEYGRALSNRTNPEQPEQLER